MKLRQQTALVVATALSAGTIIACSSSRAENPASKTSSQSSAMAQSGAAASGTTTSQTAAPHSPSASDFTRPEREVPAGIVAQTEPQAAGDKTVAVPSADEAKRLAEQHVALRKRSWGLAKNVSDQNSSYWVSFETPEQELRLLGPRVVIIDKQTGAASVQLRR